jgi:type II secretion system protein I
VRQRDERGFTLLEALVALTIVGMASITVLGAFSTEVRTADRAIRSAEAAAVAQERLAHVRVAQREVFRLLPDSLRRGTDGEYAWSVSAERSRSIEGLVDVEVQVSWDAGALSVASELYRP